MPITHFLAGPVGGVAGGTGVATPAWPDAGALLGRMRTGDREAVAEFIGAFGSLLRRRVRGKLGIQMRRLFDSQDVLSSVTRVLDRCVRSGEIRALEPGQIWSLIYKIADSTVFDKWRVFERLKRAEQEDGLFAAAMASRLNGAAATHELGAEVELERLIASLERPLFKEILVMWLRGFQHTEIAFQLGITPETVRQHWMTIRQRLGAQLTERNAHGRDPE